jgi:fatty acid desaturase
MPDEMSTADELRLIADSLQMMMPFQAARLHVLAARVHELEHGSAAQRVKVNRDATAIAAQK